MIRTKFDEDRSWNNKVMSILLCSNMKFANFRPFILYISSIFPFDQISISLKVFSSLSKDDNFQKLCRFYYALNMTLAHFRLFILDVDHFSIRSNFHKKL